MTTIYVTSSQKGAGKTMICAGLGKNLQKSGKKVGFLKLTADKKDGDAAFMKRIFNLSEPDEALSIQVSAQDGEKVKAAVAAVSGGKEVVIVEGLPSNASPGIVESLGAKVIIVDTHPVDTSKVMPDYKKFGAYLLGVVLNKVPKGKIAEEKAEVAKAGINLLGVLPEDRAIMAFTVGEVAELAKGKFLYGADKAAELVQNFMLGAMIPDHGTLYYGRKTDKAVLIRSDRPDMQMAALETPTRCIVILGKTQTVPNVLKQAAAKKVPIIQSDTDVKSLAAAIETASAAGKFNQDKKLSRLGEIMTQGFDFKLVAV